MIKQKPNQKIETEKIARSQVCISSLHCKHHIAFLHLQLDCSQHTVNLQLAHSQPTVGIQLAYSQPTFFTSLSWFFLEIDVGWSFTTITIKNPIVIGFIVLLAVVVVLAVIACVAFRRREDGTYRLNAGNKSF